MQGYLCRPWICLSVCACATLWRFVFLCPHLGNAYFSEFIALSLVRRDVCWQAPASFVPLRAHTDEHKFATFYRSSSVLLSKWKGSVRSWAGGPILAGSLNLLCPLTLASCTRTAREEQPAVRRRKKAAPLPPTCWRHYDSSGSVTEANTAKCWSRRSPLTDCPVGQAPWHGPTPRRNLPRPLRPRPLNPSALRRDRTKPLRRSLWTTSLAPPLHDPI